MSKKELESYCKEAIEKVEEILSKSLIKEDFDKVIKISGMYTRDLYVI